MGRALLITLAGVLVALSYTFLGMANHGVTMTRQNVNTYDMIKAKNTAHTGIQIAIEKYNENNKSWTGPEQVKYEGADITISLQEVKTDTLKVTSTSKFGSAKHTVISTFDISQNQSLVPDFPAALAVINGTFQFSMGGSSTINGNDPSGQCPSKPGVAVPDAGGVNEVGSHKNIAGNPPGIAKVDKSINFKDVSDLIKRLSPHAKHISGNYKGDIGTKQNPGVFFVDSYTKLTGGIDPGYGILVIRSDGELDYEGELDVAGNFEFNGLVVFENAYKFKGRGTPNINGSVMVGSTSSNANTNIDINGNINLQYNCQSKKYADNSVSNLLNTTLYKQLSVYE